MGVGLEHWLVFMIIGIYTHPPLGGGALSSGNWVRSLCMSVCVCVYCMCELLSYGRESTLSHCDIALAHRYF